MTVEESMEEECGSKRSIGLRMNFGEEEEEKPLKGT